MGTGLRYFIFFETIINPIQDGLFRDYSRMGRAKKAPLLLKLCHSYPTMTKRGTVIPYLKEKQKMYKSCFTLMEFC